MALADDLLQPARAEAIGQRARSLGFEEAGQRRPFSIAEFDRFTEPAPSLNLKGPGLPIPVEGNLPASIGRVQRILHIVHAGRVLAVDGFDDVAPRKTEAIGI